VLNVALIQSVTFRIVKKCMDRIGNCNLYSIALVCILYIIHHVISRSCSYCDDVFVLY